MKKEILLSIAILLCGGVWAQNVTITGSKIEENDGQVDIIFNVGINRVKSNERITLTPVLRGGETTKRLEKITVVGRKRQITDKRRSVSQGVRAKRNKQIAYNITIPHESWMSEVSLTVEGTIESCCTERALASQALIKSTQIRDEIVVISQVEPVQTKPEPMVVELQAVAAVQEEVSLMIMFKQGGAIIDIALGDNARLLDQACELIAQTDSDRKPSSTKVVLTGTASPEGYIRLNDRLAQGRVDALLNYLRERTKIDVDSVEVVNVGEDWSGLRKMVEESQMQYKQEVLTIIDTVPVKEGRKKQLMDLKWGRPYNYMAEHFFPQLRCAGYIRVICETKK